MIGKSAERANGIGRKTVKIGIALQSLRTRTVIIRTITILARSGRKEDDTADERQCLFWSWRCNGMSDLISRQAAIDALEEQLDYLQMLNKDENPTAENKWYGVNWARNTIAELPSAQPERQRGKWLKEYGDGEIGHRPIYLFCSRCNETTAFRYDFCPNCGADMRGGEE